MQQMLEFKNLLLLVISVAILVVFAYMLLLMLEPSPYADMVAAHVKSDNGQAASQVIATIKGSPECGKLNIARNSLLKYYKSQECYMLETEIQKHRRPTNAELIGHGHVFTTGFSLKLNACISPEKQRKLMGRIESGKNLRAFLDEIDRSKDAPGKLERLRRKMMCGS